MNTTKTPPRILVTDAEIKKFFTPQTDFSIYQKMNLAKLIDYYGNIPYKNSRFCWEISRIVIQKIFELESIDEPLELLSDLERKTNSVFNDKIEETWIKNFKRMVNSEENNHEDRDQLRRLIQREKIDKLPRVISEIIKSNQKKIEQIFSETP
jgi:hypothetical protein